MKGDEKVRSTYGLHIKHKQQQHNVLEHETKQLLQQKKNQQNKMWWLCTVRNVQDNRSWKRETY